MVDAALVTRKIAELRQRKRILEGRSIKSFSEFRDDSFLNNAVQHMIEVMIEICIDIGNHIIADEGWTPPSSNREIFEILAEKKVISRALMRMSKQMVGFRNVVVHMYERVDLELVYGIYRRHLNDFERFALAVEKFLKRRGSEALPH